MEDVRKLEVWPDLERVGQGTGLVIGNPRLNHQCKLSSFQEAGRLYSLTLKANPASAVYVIMKHVHTF